MINTPVSSAPPHSTGKEPGFLAPSSSFDYGNNKQRFNTNNYIGYDNLQQQPINFLPPITTSSNSESNSVLANSPNLVACLSNYNNGTNRNHTGGLPPASELLSSSVSTGNFGKLQQKSMDSPNQQFNGVNNSLCQFPSTSTNQQLQMQVASPNVPPPSPFLNAPAAYQSITEPGTPAMFNHNNALIGSLSNMIDYNSGAHVNSFVNF